MAIVGLDGPEETKDCLPPTSTEYALGVCLMVARPLETAEERGPSRNVFLSAGVCLREGVSTSNIAYQSIERHQCRSQRERLAIGSNKPSSGDRKPLTVYVKYVGMHTCLNLGILAFEAIR
jgi:hypothetical protein